MAFSYDAGGTTATYAGRVDFNSVRLNDGTYKTQRVPPIIGSAPVGGESTPLPARHGGYSGAVYLLPWEFDLEAWLWVPSGPDDVQGALEYLQAAYNVQAGALTMTLNARGWSEARLMTARVAGPLVPEEPDIELKKVPRRDVIIPMVADDPRRYSFTEHSQTITTATSVTNAGRYNTPLKVRFNGPRTNPQIDIAGTSGTARIRFSGTITTGNYVEINTYAGGILTATDNSSVDAYSGGTWGGTGVTAATLRTLPPGATSLTATSDAGAGTVTVYWRDAY